MADEQHGKPRAYHLRKKEDPGEGLLRIALGKADEAREGLRRANVGSDPTDEVHAVRKDLKKLRAALRMVRTGLGSKRFGSQNELYRSAGRELSGTRDAEVKAETLEALIDQFGDEMPGEETMAWRSALAEERDHAIAGMKDDRAPIEDALAAVEKGREKLARRELRVSGSDLLDGLGVSYAAGREAMKAARKERSDESFHEWRKRAKDLWYQLRIVKKSWEPMVGEIADSAHELADYLGDHHDLAVLKEDLADRDFGEETEELQKAIDARQKQLTKSAFKLGERLYAEKPKAFRRRIGKYWKAWR